MYATVAEGVQNGRFGDQGVGFASENYFYFTAFEEIDENTYVEFNVEGVFHTSADGNSFVTWMWILGEDNSIELIPIIPDAAGEPHYTCKVFTIGTRRVLDIRGVNYSKLPVWDNRSGFSSQPIPDGVVLLERPPMSLVKEGWNWEGWMISFSYLDGDNRDGGETECEPPNPGQGGERYTIRLNAREVLIVIITPDGMITVLLYRLGDDGCWRFGASPSYPTPPPNLTVPQTMTLVYAEYMYQLKNGNFVNAPPFPI